MSIQTQIEALQADKIAIANAIISKGGTVQSGDGFDDFAADIATISIPEVSTESQMNSNLKPENLGNIYKFIGTTGVYKNGDYYKVIDDSASTRFVCVGIGGKSYYSNNGTSWVAMSGLDSNTFTSVTYGKDRFVCVGIGGKSYYSTNGLTWTAMSGLDSSNYFGVTYGNDKFVCVGASGKSYYSTNGLTWTAMSGLELLDYQCVAYGKDRFVCVGANGYSYYSTDGLTWLAMSSLFATTYTGVTYGNDRFVCVGAAGKSYYSIDGTTWVAMSGLASNFYRSVTYGNGRFVCVGASGKSYYSTDGTTWTAMSGLDSDMYIGVTYGNSRFVCVGNNGKSYYSTDGTTWIAMSGLDSNNYLGVTSDNPIKYKEYMPTPTASLEITTNTTTDVTNYASVVTNIPPYVEQVSSVPSTKSSDIIYNTSDSSYYLWDPLSEPLCFTANIAGSTITCPQAFEYSLDKTTWQTASTSSAITLANIGDKVFLRNGSVGLLTGYGTFVMTGSIAASGNIMSLVDNTCKSLEITHTDCFSRLFENCTALTTPPLLPATTLTLCCYYYMFSGCTSLTIAPELPATTVCEESYGGMFRGCTSLTTAPALPATTFISYACYKGMFSGCTSLTTVPNLPSTTPAPGCYYSMFSGCTSLIVSDTQTAEAPYAWTIPVSGTFTETLVHEGTFSQCAGTRASDDMTCTVDSSVTYYTQNAPV